MSTQPIDPHVRIGHVHLKVADVERALQYLRDPDNNGVELYWDRPESEWPRLASGELAMFTHALNLDGLLQEGVSG